MQIINFKTEGEFLKELDGKVYSIANEMNNGFLFDILEKDYLVFIKNGKIINSMTIDYQKLIKDEKIGNYSDTFLSDKKYLHEIKSLAVTINIF